jgi:hypothetical protein
MTETIHDPERLAHRLVNYTVLAHDPAVPEAGATFWELSQGAYHTVVAELAGVIADQPRLVSAARRLANDSADTAAYRTLRADLAAHITADAARYGRLAQLVGDADRTILIDYHLGEGYRPAAATPVTYPTLLDRATVVGRDRAGRGFDVHIVVPFRDRHGTGRLRNLLACLIAIRDQAFDPGRIAVTAVEMDDVPRWRSVIEPLVEHYLFISEPGLFNKSWAVNAGVVNTPGQPDLICVLDADVLVDRHFLARNTQWLADGDHRAHLYYRRMYCLDAPSSDAQITRRCLSAQPGLSLRPARAYVLREPPGACVWTTAEVFHEIGGFDERFEGWGGEDEEFVDRLRLAGPFTRYDEPLLHMYHPRPLMRIDGKPFNTVRQPSLWAAAMGYGSLTHPGGRPKRAGKPSGALTAPADRGK